MGMTAGSPQGRQGYRQYCPGNSAVSGELQTRAESIRAWGARLLISFSFTPAPLGRDRTMQAISMLRIAMSACALLLTGSLHAQVVISQVYGGGGNSGSTYRSDFIDLHNTSSSAVSVDGWSLQYASAAGSSWQVTALAGNFAAGG
jgi:hypothetical protein